MMGRGMASYQGTFRKTHMGRMGRLGRICPSRPIRPIDRNYTPGLLPPGGTSPGGTVDWDGAIAGVLVGAGSGCFRVGASTGTDTGPVGVGTGVVDGPEGGNTGAGGAS